MDDLEIEIQAVLRRYFGKCAKDIDIDNATEELLDLIFDDEDEYGDE